LTSITAKSPLSVLAQRAVRTLGALAVGLCVFSVWPEVQAAEQTTLPEISAVDTIRLPADLDLLEFYLITVDTGDQVWDNFGHTALRVVDRGSNSDLVFNWGMFDTSVGNVTFASNFMRGILNYQLGVSPPSWEFGRYEREERTVWQDRINLTNAQKARLYQRLAWNLREENIVYSYQYFFDNCTTRVRDYLNEALDGRLESQNRALTQRSFRDEVLAHYATVPPVAFSLDVLMNARIDRRMSQWEELFLPARLRQDLLTLQSDTMGFGQRQPLLDDSLVVMEFEPPAPQVNFYYALGAILFAPLILMFFSLKRVPIASFSSQPDFTLSAPGFNYRLMGLLALLLALIGGVFGLIMSFAWMQSGHLDLHQNLNLLIFWPTDILAIPFALRWLIFGRFCTISKGAHSVVVLYLLARLASAFVYVFVALTGIAAQDVVSLIIFVVPALMGFAILVWAAGFSAVRRIRFS
jgi:hypothetical protein